MKKLFCLIIALCTIVCTFVSCAKNDDVKKSDNDSKASFVTAPESYTFTDALGREVTVKSHERVAALLGSYADLWIIAGGNICAAPDDAWEDFQISVSQKTVNLGGTKDLSLEALLSADPDLVLASTNTPQHIEWQKTLEDAGITVAYFDVATFEDYLEMLKVCTSILGTPGNYKKYGEGRKEDIEKIREAHKNDAEQKVLVLRASANMIRAKNSQDNVMGEMLKDFNCVNIADSDESLLENLSIESILLQDPDRIFIVEVGDDTEGIKKNVEKMFAENPLWNDLTAVKNGKIHYMEKALFNLKPNAKWAQAYKELEAILNAEK